MLFDLKDLLEFIKWFTDEDDYLYVGEDECYIQNDKLGRVINFKFDDEQWYKDSEEKYLNS